MLYEPTEIFFQEAQRHSMQYASLKVTYKKEWGDGEKRKEKKRSQTGERTLVKRKGRKKN